MYVTIKLEHSRLSGHEMQKQHNYFMLSGLSRSESIEVSKILTVVII